MSENKTGKYLKYAVGEILLVMIGILLALQVNNWNNNRLEKQLEVTILKQAKQDIQSMFNDLRGDKETLEKGIQSHLNIVDYIEKDVTYHDSMCFDFYWLIKDEYMYPITSAYDVLKAEGLDLIQNDSIRQGLQYVYEFVLPRIGKEHPFYPDLEEFFSDFYHKNFTVNNDPDLVYNFRLYDFDFQYPMKDHFNGRTYDVYLGYVPIDFESLKTSTEFQVLLRQAFRYRLFKHNRYNSAITALELLTTKINDELELDDD